MIQIREYTSSDIKDLSEVFEENIPKYFDPNEIKDFVEYLENYADTYLTVLKDNNIVGGVGYVIDEKKEAGGITWIFFAKDCQGDGLGKKAVNYCLDIIDKKVNKTIVTTSQYAYKFFEKFDFRLIRCEKDYWGEGLDLYEMIREI